jgi:hypothetical protein
LLVNACRGLEDRVSVEQFNRLARGAAADVSVVRQRSDAHVSHEGLNRSERYTPLYHVADKRVPQIMEAQTGQPSFLASFPVGRYSLAVLIATPMTTYYRACISGR